MSVLIEQIIAVARAAEAAGHGKKGAIYDKACKDLCMSRQTLLRKIKELTIKKPRKRRSDFGKTELTRQEMLTISGVLIESTRQTEKTLFSVERGTRALRADNKIMAGRINKETGEFIPYSASTISRALYQNRLHPKQLKAPAPAKELASLHPNHVWQLDASICVLYYLRNGARGKERSSLCVMNKEEFYKNKPENFEKIVSDRLWSFEITDHASGWIYVEYVLGAESGVNFCSVLINAMQARGGADILHGVPKILYTDPGASLKAPMMRNLCRALGIELLSHSAGNARATGSVEKARDIIERSFEAGLKFFHINSLEEINALAAKWRALFNETEIHHRHKQTRNHIWNKYIGEHLVLAPSKGRCQLVAAHAPETRKVTNLLRISFQGKEYDVSTVPDIYVNQTILVTYNAFFENKVMAVLMDEEGRETFFPLDHIEKNELGFANNANLIGKDWTQHARTATQIAAEEIEMLMMQVDTPEEAQKARKAKKLPFDGNFNPYRELEDTNLPVYLPQRGQASTAHIPTIEIKPLTHVEAAKLLKEKVAEWSAEHFKWLVKNFPTGIQEEQLNEVAELLNQNNELNKVVNFSR